MNEARGELVVNELEQSVGTGRETAGLSETYTFVLAVLLLALFPNAVQMRH
jgi:hypothetical protein